MTNWLSAIARALFQGGGSLRQQVLRGSAWVLSTHGLQQVMGLARSIVLARLLAPADFGVMSLVNVSIAALLVFTETGIWQALIQRKELNDDLLHTAWIISAIRGALLALLVFVSAPLLASFFRTPALGPVMRVMAVTQLLNGLISLGPRLLQRGMDFKKLAYWSLGYDSIGLVASVVAAVLLRSVWALVIGSISSAVASLVVSYLLHPYRPRLRFSRGSAGELIRFGKHLTGSSIVNYLCSMGDNAYIGRVLGTEAVGFYDQAYRLGNLPANSITTVFSRVSFPAFSSIQDDLERTRRLYLRGLHYLTLVAVPVCGAMLALAPYIISVLYGEKWMPAVPALTILCLFGLERAINSISGQVCLAQGRPDLGFKMVLLKLGVMALGIVPLTARYGFAGTAIAVTLSAVSQILWIPVTARLLRLPVRSVLKQLHVPVLGTLLLVGSIMLLRNAFAWPMTAVSLLALALMGGTAYAVFVGATDRDLVTRINQAVTAWGLGESSQP